MKNTIRVFLSIILFLSLVACSDGNDDLNPSNSNETADSIRIASFNIQVFGQSKLSEDETMDFIVKIIKNFDAVAIQEIRSKEQTVIPTL